jgi:hypothetical protein
LIARGRRGSVHVVAQICVRRREMAEGMINLAVCKMTGAIKEVSVHARL